MDGSSPDSRGSVPEGVTHPDADIPTPPTPVHPALPRMSPPTTEAPSADALHPAPLTDPTFVGAPSTDALRPGPVVRDPIIGRLDGTEPATPMNAEALIANTPPREMALGMARSGVPEEQASDLLRQYYPDREEEIGTIFQDPEIRGTFEQVRTQPAPEGTIDFGQTEGERETNARRFAENPDNQRAAQQLAEEGKQLLASGASEEAKQSWLGRVKEKFGASPGKVLMGGLGIFVVLFLYVLKINGGGGGGGGS